MRLVHFSHRGHKRFGVLLSDDRVLDLTQFFEDEHALRAAGDDGLRTVREAMDRARLRRSAGGNLYSLEDIVLENPDPPPPQGDHAPANEGGADNRIWLTPSLTGIRPWQNGFGIHLIQKVRAGRR